MDDLVQELNVLRIDCNQNKANCDQNNRQLAETIERYAKTVLSITWDQELVITSDDFKTENSEKVMTSIQYLLDGIRQLCQELDENRDDIIGHNDYQSVRSLLGIDFAECLLWRKAGLLYAFCNCRLSGGIKLNSDSVLIEDNKQLTDEEVRHKVLQYLIDGIQWFRLFLSQRQPFDDMISNSNTDQLLNTSEALIAHNIFSDNHLLSLMYLSEMCFWYQIYSNHWRLYLHTNGFDVEECAKRCLKLYINAVDNHFKPLGWNCDKAKQLLHLINR